MLASGLIVGIPQSILATKYIAKTIQIVEKEYKVSTRFNPWSF
jgi:hypothetical protein